MDQLLSAKDRLIYRASWALLLSISSYAASQIRDMSISIQELNKNVAVAMHAISVQDKAIEKHGGQIEALEKEVWGTK